VDKGWQKSAEKWAKKWSRMTRLHNNDKPGTINQVHILTGQKSG
jgi:hypothetical protein